jgi:hypothetical protein
MAQGGSAVEQLLGKLSFVLFGHRVGENQHVLCFGPFCSGRQRLARRNFTVCCARVTAVPFIADRGLFVFLVSAATVEHQNVKYSSG